MLDALVFLGFVALAMAVVLGLAYFIGLCV
jgi:hypothetical protein